MPELPEVETTRRGIEPLLVGRTIKALVVHEPRLRWPVPPDIETLTGSRIEAVARRGKYLLIESERGTALLHLGMSGSLRVSECAQPRRKHDHVELVLPEARVLRFHDPRRFGCLLWQPAGAPPHALLRDLGPEPLSEAFDGAALHAACRGRRLAIKNLVMNARVVVGVGNIYANEALFDAGVRPGRAAGRVTRPEAERLVAAIKRVLARSIEVGGTTLRDFVSSDGEPGYFRQSLAVYGRTGEPCRRCGRPIRQRLIGQRSSFYCTHCQR